MGNEQSTAKIIAMARQRNDFTLSCGGEDLRAEWIPDNAITVGIKNLKLTSMRLEICPPIIFQADDIVHLSLADNRLVTIANINNLMNLETLDISGNCLEFLSDDICGLKNLKSLNVSKNKLTNRGIAPGIFDLGLESLDLSKNKIVDAVPELLLFVGKVKDVKLHENPWANEKLAGIQESTTKDEIDLIVKEIQDSKPKEALEPPKPFSDATSPDVVTDTSPKGVMQPQAPAIPPKKKPSKKLAIGTVQRENSLKSISEQTTGELSPGTDAPPPQITPRLSEAEPLQQAAPRISEIVSPQIDGPSRTGETLKPMSRAKGPKKKNSISDAPSPESKAPAPRASSVTQAPAPALPSKKGRSSTNSEKAEDEEKSVSKGSKIASFFKQDKQEKQSKAEEKAAEASGPPPMPPKHTKPASRSRIEDDDDTSSISSEISRMSSVKKSGGLAPQIDMSELKLRQRKLTDVTPAPSINVNETSAPPANAPQIDMAELKLRQQRKVTDAKAPMISITETQAPPPAHAPQVDMGELKARQQRKVTDAKQPSFSFPESSAPPMGAPQVDMAELKLRQQRKVTDTKSSTAPVVETSAPPAGAPQVDMAELKLRQQKKVTDAKPATESPSPASNAPQIDMSELKSKQQRKLTESSGSANAPEPNGVTSPTPKSATAAPVIAPRPSKDTTTPTAAPALAPRPSKDGITSPASATAPAPAIAPRPSKDSASAPVIAPRPVKEEAKAPQLPSKGGDKLQAELKAALPTGNMLKPSIPAKETNPEPEAESNSAIPPWKLEMEKRKQQKAAQTQP